MNIIFAQRNDISLLESKYTILELDTLKFENSNQTQTAWCVIETDKLGLSELPTLSMYKELHNNMMHNYQQRNWKYCEDALEHLMGKWGGEVDSFYIDFTSRIKQHKQADPGPDWDGTYLKSN